jgi:hypothetical protein
MDSTPAMSPTRAPTRATARATAPAVVAPYPAHATNNGLTVPPPSIARFTAYFPFMAG